MATASYMNGRKKYTRPQAILWSDNPGEINEGIYVPSGYETGALISITAVTPSSPSTGYVKYTANNILSAGDIVFIQGISPTGYNGTYSVVSANGVEFVVANATTTTVTDGTGDALPNGDFLILSDDNRGEIQFTPQRIEQRKRMVNGRMRSYHVADKMQIQFSWQMLPSRSTIRDPDYDSTGATSLTYLQKYTSDGGAGGVEVFDWYQNHKGPFWVFLAYDKYSNFDKGDAKYGHLSQYNEVIEMYISNFSYTIQKRGGTTYDFWNISVTLEEV
jgi:hypothetical protein